MNSSYIIFGLTVSSNVCIPGLTPEAQSCEPDIKVYLGICPAPGGFTGFDAGQISYSSAELSTSGRPLVRIWQISNGDFVRVEFDEGATFWLDRVGRNVWTTWQPPLTLDDAISYLLGPIFGLLMRFRGVVCLHASAVSISGRAVAFVGPEGAGKSTAAAAFASRGYAVLSDDIVALVEQDSAFYVFPAYPHLGLWPDSVETIFGSADAAPRFSATWDKRRVALGDSRLPFETRALALRGIFLLGERQPGPAAIRSMPLRDALLALIANSYGTNALESQARAKELFLLGRLVSAVPVFNLQAPSDSGRLTEICECVPRVIVSAATLTDAARS